MDKLKKLNDPLIVAKFQHAFGVRTYCDEDGHFDKDPKISCECSLRKGDSYKCQNASDLQFEVTNKFWLWVFEAGSALGHEGFYTGFFAIWLWNLDGVVGRQVLLMWSISIFIGQLLKDVIRWKRPPCPPVVKLEKRWLDEYAMPSTHAMVAVSVPFGTIIFTYGRYEYPLLWALGYASVYCLLVCCCRLYLGMHTVADIFAGLLLVSCLMIIIVPLMNPIDHFILTSSFSPITVLLIMFSIIVFYPNCPHWTPTRLETAEMTGSEVGCALGVWCNYQLGYISEPIVKPPYTIDFTGKMMGLAVIRTIIGLAVVCSIAYLSSKILKPIIRPIVYLLYDDTKIEEGHTFQLTRDHYVLIFRGCIVFIIIGFTVQFLVPILFRSLSIQRTNWHTEV